MNRRKSMKTKKRQHNNFQGQQDLMTGGGFWETVKTFLAVGVGSVLGMFGVYMLIGLFSLVMIWLGSLLIGKNTKKEEGTNKSKIHWNLVSSFGAFLVFIGLLPWVAFFFQGLMFNLGANVAEHAWQKFTS